jgi:hypothetical protein
MTRARTACELRRWSDLATIRCAIRVLAPEFAQTNLGLKDVAELCKRSAASRPGRDWNAVRGQILTIGCEWDLASDNLDQQSDACLECLAQFLV